MKKLFNLAILGLVSVLFVACGVDNPQTNGDGKLMLSTNRTKVDADSISVAQLTAVLNGDTVTSECEFYANNSAIKLTNGKFVTAKEGTYKIKAIHKSINSNQVVVVALKALNSDYVFEKHVAVLYGTSTSCVWCPSGVKRLREAEKGMPGLLIPIFLHDKDLAPKEPPTDPFDIPQTHDVFIWMMGGIGGLPAITFDNVSSMMPQTPFILDDLDYHLRESSVYNGQVGIAISSKVEGKNVTATIKVKNANKKLETERMRLICWIVEDNIKFSQLKGDETKPNSAGKIDYEYIHNAVARKAILPSGASVAPNASDNDPAVIGFGIPTKDMVVDGEHTSQYTYTIPEKSGLLVENEFVAENMKIVAYIMIGNAGQGQANNKIISASQAKFGETLDYEYYKKK